MSDIFISYARGDRDSAKMLSEILMREGWSVWWDRNISPGKSFDEVIEKALDVAECVIVLWSRESVSSHWVKAEAAEGARRGILVPILLEGVKLPLEFRRLQVADLSNCHLSDWQAASLRPEFANILKAVTQTLDGASEVKTPYVPMPDARESKPLRGSINVRGGWHAEPIETGRATRKIRVHLTEEEHVIEFTNHVFGSEVATVDGKVRCKVGAATDPKEYLEFEVSDGTAKRVVAMWYEIGFFGGVSRFRLSVAGHTLYNEEDS